MPPPTNELITNSVYSVQKSKALTFANFSLNFHPNLRLLHMMNVRFSLLNMVHRILGVTLPNF
jgi:hypothetical protein